MVVFSFTTSTGGASGDWTDASNSGGRKYTSCDELGLVREKLYSGTASKQAGKMTGFATGLLVDDVKVRRSLLPTRRPDLTCEEDGSTELVRFILVREDPVVTGFAMVVSGLAVDKLAFLMLLAAWLTLLGVDRVERVSLLCVDKLDFHFNEDVVGLLTCVCVIEALSVDEAVTIFEEELRGAAAASERGMLGRVRMVDDGLKFPE